MLRIVGVFAIVGFGLGIGTMLFLWVTGFFNASNSLEDLGQAFLGGIAIAGVLVFAILIGVVLAAVGGIHLASTSTDRTAAAATGALSGGAGHFALVVTLGAVLLIGFAFASNDEGSGTSTTSTSDRAQCEEVFGAGAEACTDESTVPESSSDNSSSSDSDNIDFATLTKLVLGVIPAGMVGGLTAAVVFRPRQA